MPSSGFFDTIFAVDGDLTAVPDGVQGDGSVSYAQGYGVDYSTPVGSGGLNIERAKMNQLFNDITSAIQAIQLTGVPPYFAYISANGGYALGATVMKSNVTYVSLINSNTDVPPSSNWKISNLNGSMLAFSTGATTIGATANNSFGLNAAVGSGALSAFIIPFNYKISSFYGYAAATPTTGSRAYTVFINGSGTALTATATGTSSTASDLTHSATGNAGDQIEVNIVTSGSDVVAHKASLMIQQTS